MSTRHNIAESCRIHIFCAYLPVSYATCPAHLMLLGHYNIICWSVQMIKLLVQFSLFSRYFISEGPIILLTNTPPSYLYCSPCRVRDQVSHSQHFTHSPFNLSHQLQAVCYAHTSCSITKSSYPPARAFRCPYRVWRCSAGTKHAVTRPEKFIGRLVSACSLSSVVLPQCWRTGGVVLAGRSIKQETNNCVTHTQVRRVRVWYSMIMELLFSYICN
jgi:hypothetical protein